MCQWHDYHITGYCLDGEGKKLTLYLAWLYESGPHRSPAHLVFTGVAGHRFEDDDGTGVVACIGEEDLDDFLRRMQPEFVAREPWCWPAFWRRTLEATAEHIRADGARCYFLDSAIGMHGWIVAKGLDHHAVGPNCCGR